MAAGAELGTKGFETRQIHVGDISAEDPFGARIPPIYASNAFRFDSLEHARRRFANEEEGQLYSRHLNPTTQVAEQRIASLEGGSEAIVVASGQAAVSSVLLTLAEAGDHIVSAPSIYSGTQIQFNRALRRTGIEVEYVSDPHDPEQYRALIRPQTKALFVETIPNPKNDVVDIAAVGEIAREHGLPLVVDNTIATPVFVRPLEHGAHIVVHSASKYLAGHGAVIAGAIVDGGTFDWAGASRRYPLITDRPAPDSPSHLERVGARRAFAAAARFTSVNDFGPAVSPFNAFLLQQGMETLSLRMERHAANAAAIAQWLTGRAEVESVDYAALPGNPNHGIAQRYFDGHSGAVFSFTLKGGRAAAEAFFDSLQLISKMTNIGDVRSMALHPATTTHGGFTEEHRQRLGIGQGLIRLSIGIETLDDLLADLDQALGKATVATS